MMNINIELLTKLGFYKDEHLTQEYYDCYRLYNYFLLSYLNEKIHLTKLEEEALTMKNPFKPLSLDEKDFFQKLSPLKFFYIRNILKIEKLSSKDIQFLKDRNQNKQFSFDEEAKQMINDSYKEVVKDHDGYEKSIVSYGDFSSGKFFASNDAIVLGIRIDPQYDLDTDDNPHWLEDYCERETYVSLLGEEVEKKAKELNLSLRVIEYKEAAKEIPNFDLKTINK